MIGFRDVTKSLKLDEDINDIGKVFMVTDTIKIGEILVDARHELQPKSCLLYTSDAADE